MKLYDLFAHPARDGETVSDRSQKREFSLNPFFVRISDIEISDISYQYSSRKTDTVTIHSSIESSGPSFERPCEQDD